MKRNKYPKHILELSESDFMFVKLDKEIIKIKCIDGKAVIEREPRG
jgi:hypothetical protein